MIGGMIVLADTCVNFSLDDSSKEGIAKVIVTDLPTGEVEQYECCSNDLSNALIMALDWYGGADMDSEVQKSAELAMPSNRSLRFIL